METYREALKRLFLGELLVDPGWSDYMDLLLDNMSFEFLHYLGTSGFPYEFTFFGYNVDSLTSVADILEEEIVEDGEVVQTLVTLKFNTGLSGKEYLDFGDIVVFPFNCEVASVVTGGAPLWVKTELALTGASADPETGDVPLPGEFWVRYDKALPFDGSASSPRLFLNRIPQSVNPAFVIQGRKELRSSFSPMFPAVSPYLLYKAVYDLGIDFEEFPFQIYFESVGSRGVSTKSYPRFVSFLSATQARFPEGMAPVWDLVSQEDVLVNPLFDMWGVSAGRVVPIYGYDKKYFVVADNSLPDGGFITSLTLDREESSRSVDVFLSGEWDVQDTDPGGSTVDDVFKLPLSGLEYGITKEYQSRSFLSGELSTVVIEFEALPEVFFESNPGILEALNNILANSLPPGVRGEVRFRYADLYSSIHIEDMFLVSDHWIKINDESEASVTLAWQDASTGSVEVTIEGGAAWSAYTEDEGFARQGIGVMVLDGEDESTACVVGE